MLGQLALAPLGRHAAVAGRVYGRHHGRQVVGPRPGAGGGQGGQGGQGRHPALQRGELQPGPIQGSTRLSAEGRYNICVLYFRCYLAIVSLASSIRL